MREKHFFRSMKKIFSECVAFSENLDFTSIYVFVAASLSQLTVLTFCYIILVFLINAQRSKGNIGKCKKTFLMFATHFLQTYNDIVEPVELDIEELVHDTNSPNLDSKIYPNLDKTCCFFLLISFFLLRFTLKVLLRYSRN